LLWKAQNKRRGKGGEKGGGKMKLVRVLGRKPGNG